jgi:hypothetical protein
MIARSGVEKESPPQLLRSKNDSVHGPFGIRVRVA